MISDETRKRIEHGIFHWNDLDSEERRCYEAAKLELDKRLKKYEDATSASERLTERDMNFRVDRLY